MSFASVFPGGVADIPLYYLPYPELLTLEGSDPEVAQILAQPHFWRIRLRDEYKLSDKELAGITDVRAEYHRRYIRDHLQEVAQEGYLFEAGQLCLPLMEEDYAFIASLGKENVIEFVTGARVGECKNIGRLARIAQRGVIDPRLALHTGDEKLLRESFHVYEGTLSENVFGRSVPRNYYPFSEAMIDNGIKWGMKPAYLRTSLLRRGRPKDLLLVQYIDERYGHLLAQEDGQTERYKRGRKPRIDKRG